MGNSFPARRIFLIDIFTHLTLLLTYVYWYLNLRYTKIKVQEKMNDLKVIHIFLGYQFKYGYKLYRYYE